MNLGCLCSQFDSEFDEVSADNDTIETKADSIIDFSETNPFGIPE